MQSIAVGIVFLLAGGFVYAYNTESHDSKILFARFGLNLGETETVAVLLGVGVLFLAIGAVRWLAGQGGDEEGDESSME